METEMTVTLRRRPVPGCLRAALVALAMTGLASGSATALDITGAPSLDAAVASGDLPPAAERVPERPLIVSFDQDYKSAGTHGGQIKMLMRRAKDTRQMTVYGYARLVRYSESLEIVPDILEKVDVEDGGRQFTLHLRPGHKWSDGDDFTTEDFRYWWEDVANNEALFPVGPPAYMKAGGSYPSVEILDAHTIRYSWPVPHPDFLPGLAQASPRYIYAPSHYLRQFHENYADAEALAALVEAEGRRNWGSLHTNKGRLYRNDNPDLPVLQPFHVETESPSERFVFERNPFFHRVDPNGLQLPYLDRVIVNISEKKLIAAKTATGEVDLQARYLRFDDFTLLKQNEQKEGYQTHLWKIAKGAHLALYPNMNQIDPVWRDLMREPDFRRALSLGVNRYEINRAIYFGLATEGQNTMLPGSPLYAADLRENWATFDVEKANALLDGLGLERGLLDGVRRLPNGEKLEIIVETGGATTEETDVLQLITDTWREIGVSTFIKPLSTENLRNRVFAGESQFVIAPGWENGLATADMSPRELAPTAQIQYQWPMWGQYFETNGNAGEPIDLPEAQRLKDLLNEWYGAPDHEARKRAWDEMLAIHSDQVFVIGLIAGVSQPVVVKNGLRNMPKEGLWNWDPGAHFGLYGIDTLWWDL